MPILLVHHRIYFISKSGGEEGERGEREIFIKASRISTSKNYGVATFYKLKQKLCVGVRYGLNVGEEQDLRLL
jgi:hypothetical protein